MKVNGKRVKEKEEEYIIIKMEVNMKEFGIMMNM